MKISEQWVNEFFNEPVTTVEAMTEQLTMLGLEVEGYDKRNQNTGVVVGYVADVQPHPQAKKLQVCTVYVEADCQQPLTIVCGASNIRADCYVPVACIGAQLANGLTIEQTQLRGVTSQGMICSQKELGLTEDAEGILILPAQADAIGDDFARWARLDDHVIDLSITPNRGDCLSMLGIARELSAAYRQPLLPSTSSAKLNEHKRYVPINNQAPQACPHYLTCQLEGVNNQVQLPYWLIERLQRCDVRSVNPVVDILNYVMLELGQPMHAFAVSSITKSLQVRFAQSHEQIILLGDDQAVQLDSNTLVIADDQRPLAIAGVKGGDDSAVDLSTDSILLESAFFDPTTISGVARRYGLNTDSAYRFERGVDYQLPEKALKRAIELIKYYLGGQAGPIHGSENSQELPQPSAIDISPSMIQRQLGIELAPQAIADYWQALAMQVDDLGSSWSVTPPSWRFDINIGHDLVEEIARLYGYNALGSVLPSLSPCDRQQPLQRDGLWRLKSSLQDLGYHEAINYSFIDPSYNAWWADYQPVALSNPIASDMAQMRVSLWPGLLMNVQHNLNRQQPNMRLFEEGLCFYRPASGASIQQQSYIAAVNVGARMPEHWSLTTTPVSDFFDIKGDVENILEQQHLLEQTRFEPVEHPVLHPGRSARIECCGQILGYIGCLHPSVAQQLDITSHVYLFEMDVDLLRSLSPQPTYQALSKYPQVRRDFAFVVDQTVSAQAIADHIREVGGEDLVDVAFFDMFTGEGVEPGCKSLAVAVTWQHTQRTLQDEEIQAHCQTIVEHLQTQLGAKIRD